MVEATSYPLPHVGVLPDKYQKAAMNLNDQVPALLVTPFSEAFSAHYQSDAHFVPYAITSQSKYPRLGKPILPRLRMLSLDITASMIVLDYDNPGHSPWVPGGIDEFLTKLNRLSETWPLAMQWTLFYTTRNGARLIYVLKEPVPVDQFEGRHLGMCQKFNSLGIPIDQTVSDWTRVFRLPYVTRDSYPTWLAAPEVSEYIEQLGNRVDIEEIPNAGASRVNEYAEVGQFDIPKPTQEYCRALLQAVNIESGRMTSTEFYQQAKRRLRGRECYGCLFEHKPLADRGTRDDTIHKFVGQVVSLLYYLEGTEPEHIFALFMDPVEQLEQDPRDKPWLDVLWAAVGRNWMKEEAKHKAAIANAEAKAADAATLGNRMLEGMKEWCRHPDLFKEKEKAVQWNYLERHFIASQGGKAHYIMNEGGHYDPTPLDTSLLIAAIRAKGMDDAIATTTMNEQGVVMDRAVNQIINQYATVVQDIFAKPQIEHAYIEDMDTENATLMVPCFSRAKHLIPCYDPSVDQWLRVLFGDNYDLGRKWIAWSLAFDEGPICALSIQGRAGAGKKMLAVGLSECLTSPKLAGAEDLVGQYQYGLLKSPFLVIDEGWPKATLNSARHPADQFRSMVSGQPITVNRKFMPPINIINPVRVLLTGNNIDVVKMLTAGRELSPEDREALAIRLLHFNVRDEAAIWLQAQGGVKFTGAPGRRWIRGDGGADSDFVLARHFLYLYEVRHTLGMPGNRFLVEGNADQDIMTEMRTQSGKGPLVIEAIIRMIELAKRLDGLVISDDRLFALSSEVLQFFRNNMSSQTREQMNTSNIINVFKGLAIVQRDFAFVVKERESLGKRRWQELDCELLLNVATSEGWKCDTLLKVVEKQRERKQNGTLNHNKLTGVAGEVPAPAHYYQSLKQRIKAEQKAAAESQAEATQEVVT